MRTVVKPWGNSAAIRIPKPILEDSGIALGNEVDVRAEGDRVVIEAVVPAVSIEELVAAIRPEHLHREVNFGAQRGGEAW